MRTPKKNLHRTQRGFALVVTLTLMVLLTVIALGLLSLSAVEIRSNQHGQAQAEARANARLGVLLALGRLQQTLGPDARATANSSILDTDPSSAVIDGVRHSHWLGAYPTINPSSPDAGLLSPRSLRDWSLDNMEWLVSSPDAGGKSDPTAALSGDAVTLGQFIDDASETVPDNSGIDSLPAAKLSKAQAGLVKVAGDSGRYAWWVSDESMKARIDTLASPDGSDVLDGSVVDADDQNRSNYEVIQGNDFSEQLPGYKDSAESLSKLITYNQLEQLGNGTAGATWGNWSKLNQDKFTPYSASLPVDVANGRLKQDLTAYLKGNYTGLDDQAMIDSRFSISAPKVPSFNLLKQWANLVTDRSQPQSVVVPDESTTSPRLGLNPTITQAAVGMQHSYKILTQTTMQPVCLIQPQIQLWNPHNVPLAAQDYIVQVGYQFQWDMKADGTKGSDKFAFTPNPNDPRWRSYEVANGMDPLPVHKAADNETINYQGNKRFFTFVIKDQAFQPGETLIFFAKPPSSGPISGVQYNMQSDADTDILKNYSSDQDLNLLWNEGTLDEFFYIVLPSVGTAVSNAAKNNLATGINTESNFLAHAAGSGAGDANNLDIHANLYAFQDNKPSLLHAIKIAQHNTRTGNWRNPIFPLSSFQDGSKFANDDIAYDAKDPLINIGSSMLASNFDIFAGGGNINLPPSAGQPHSVLNLWNIRSQEAFSKSDAWGTGLGSSWINTFSFRDVNVFKTTWEVADNLYGTLSTDRLGGWHQSQVQNMVYPFFDYPTGTFGPMSMGAFQHANLSVYSWQPTFPFGNAQAPPRLSRSEYKSGTQPDLYDISYLLNASTWDSYFLSTIPQDGKNLTNGMRLPNSRQVLQSVSATGAINSSELKNTDGFELSAASVRIQGGFNVNSTSVLAWKALLSGALGQSVKAVESGVDSNVAEAAAMGRFLAPLLEEPQAIANDRESTLLSEPNSWAATRTLNAGEIETLASRVVEEVKRRGPFLSLADFVNRRLEPDSDVTGDERVYQEVLGTLQAAINKATMETKQINHHFYTNNGKNGTITRIKPSQDWDSINFSVSQDTQEAMFGLPVSKIDSDGGLIQSYSPNYLSQADVLTKIAPSITVRGDTYVIRSYGDSLNPTTGEVVAKAWCEAVVQRGSEPVGWDGSNAKLVQPQAPTETGFGRRFEIVAFRWLNENDVMPFEDDAAIVK